jgi:hypothetical protein
MVTDYFERMNFGGKEYFWSYINQKIEHNDLKDGYKSTETISYRVFELSAYYDIYQKGFCKEVFENDYEPPTLFIPLEIMSKNNEEIIDWCDNFCTTCV